MTKVRRITFRISDRLFERLQKYADEHDIDISNAIRYLLSEKLRLRE